MMRALTLTQPWCGLVASGIKRIENRPRSMIKPEDFGEPFALHASREIDESVYDRIRQIAPALFDGSAFDDAGEYDGAPWYRLTRITSAVIAVATIDNVVDPSGRLDGVHEISQLHPDQRRWFFGPIGYVLRDVRALATPVPCRGWQGFWHLTSKGERERGVWSAVERDVMGQLR